MNERLKHSGFFKVLFPTRKKTTVKPLFLHTEQSLRIDMNKLLLEQPWVIFDFETTGLSAKANEIIEIGALKYHQGECIDKFHSMVKPEKGVPERITRITGIDASMVKDAPPLEDIFREFLKFIRGSILFAHNMSFDKSFLLKACESVSFTLNYPFYCTMKMARFILPNLERHNLDTVAEHYNISFTERHRSIGDVEVTAQLLMHMLQESELKRINELRDFMIV